MLDKYFYTPQHSMHLFWIQHAHRVTVVRITGVVRITSVFTDYYLFYHNNNNTPIIVLYSTLQKNFAKLREHVASIREQFANIRELFVNVCLHITSWQIFNSVHEQNIT